MVTMFCVSVPMCERACPVSPFQRDVNRDGSRMNMVFGSGHEMVQIGKHLPIALGTARNNPLILKVQSQLNSREHPGELRHDADA